MKIVDNDCDKKSFWQAVEPKHADEIMAILDPFKAPDLSFDLKNPAGNLIESARRAARWASVHDVIIVRPEELPNKYPNNIWYPVSVRLLSIYAHQIEDSLGHWLNQNFSKSQFVSDLMEKVRISVMDGFGSEKWETAWDAFQVDFPRSIANGLEASLFYACGTTITGINSDFEPLLSIWRSGNLPLGFDQKGNFGVLCSN